MNELSLFSGAGGGLLASKYLLGWKTIGMVENDKYCQKELQQRQEDGLFDQCPIFGDIKEFIKSGYAASYQGLVDVITAGFPCQPFSIAGSRKGADDPKNLWPQTIEVIRTVKPEYVFLENVLGLLSSNSRRCICGGADGWRRMYYHRERFKEKALLFKGRNWDDESNKLVADFEKYLRWKFYEDEKRIQKMGRSAYLAYFFGQCHDFFEEDISLFNIETATGYNWNSFARIDKQCPKTSKQNSEMVRRSSRKGKEAKARDASTQQKGAKKDASPLVCKTCGRSMDNTTTESFRYVGRIFADLAEAGYNASWKVLGASDVGASHQRKRLWILAYADKTRL